VAKSERFHAYVLHKRPYRETSMLVDFFTLEQGRMSAVAKGARGNVKSDRKSLLQGFQKSELDLSGRSNLKNLGKIEASGVAFSLNEKALYCGFYLNEILSRALPDGEPFEDLFANYEHTLLQLSSVKSNELRSLEPILREFELSLLHTMGYLPDFEHDCESEKPIQADYAYYFDAASGFVQTHPANKLAIMGIDILEMTKGEYFDDDKQSVRRAAKIVCRAALRHLIGDKPIKSRELFLLT
jgi:DNA repair protein RecO (recombination protein O)